MREVSIALVQMKPTLADIEDNLRRMGEFEPARLGPEELEYTSMTQILEKLGKRFETLKEAE